jgi:hypothetical protein
MAPLCGGTGRRTPQNGGFWPSRAVMPRELTLDFDDSCTHSTVEIPQAERLCLGVPRKRDEAAVVVCSLITSYKFFVHTNKMSRPHRIKCEEAVFVFCCEITSYKFFVYTTKMSRPHGINVSQLRRKAITCANKTTSSSAQQSTRTRPRRRAARLDLVRRVPMESKTSSCCDGGQALHVTWRCYF